MIFIILIWIAIFVLLLLSWYNLMEKSRKYNINGPSPLPVLGSAHLFIVKSTEFLGLLHKLSQKYGDAYLVHLFSYPYVVLSHPKYIEPIVSSVEHITKGRSYEFMKSWLGEGLLTASGQRWKSHRKFLTPAFHFNILQNFLPVFCKNGRVLTDKLGELADGESINLFPIIARAALDNVTEAIMGVSVNAQNEIESEYVKSIETVSGIISLRMQIPLIGPDFIFNLLPLKTKHDKALKLLHTQTKNVIEARKKELKKLNITTLRGSNDLGIKNKHAFLDLLLLAEVDGHTIDEESVREEVDTFMFEGHDTTTSGIVFSLFCISKYPEIQNKIYDEQRSIFVDDLQRDPTFTELHQMKYLELVIKESMRLYPSVPIIERMITKDSVVGELNLLKGTSVTLNIFQMQRHPELYDHPMEFRPERFEHSEQKNPFNYLVFSAGPRNCIGQKFAMMEMKVTVSEIVRRFELLPSDKEPQLCADLILRSTNGVHVKLIPRKK